MKNGDYSPLSHHGNVLQCKKLDLLNFMAIEVVVLCFFIVIFFYHIDGFGMRGGIMSYDYHRRNKTVGMSFPVFLKLVEEINIGIPGEW